MAEASRLKLQEELETLLGVKHVYYQPPESLKIEYPAIIYSRDDIQRVAANNTAYTLHNHYQVIVVDKRPGNPVIEKILELPMSSFVRSYKADNLYHDVTSLYY